MTFLAHGTCDDKGGSALSFGYSCGNQTCPAGINAVENGKYEKTDANNLQEAAFTSNAVITSYACRTGAGVDVSSGDGKGCPSGGILYNKDQNCLNSTSTSLAQTLSNKTGATVYAFLSRTDYTGTLGTWSDRHEFSPFSEDAYEKWNKSTKTIDGAVWNSNGAYNGVSGIVGSPSGVSGNKYKFVKNGTTATEQ